MSSPDEREQQIIQLKRDLRALTVFLIVMLILLLQQLIGCG